VQPGYIYINTDNCVTYSEYGGDLNYSENCTNTLKQLEKILADEIILNSVSEVKCGILLSGGVDSALLASLWQKYVKKPIIAYNLSFKNSVVDESERAKDIANKLNLQYKIITIDETKLEGYFAEFISVMDQPSIDGFNTYLITKLIDNDTKVLLSGAGADELFLGYDFYKHILFRPKIRKIFTYVMRKIHSLRPNRFTERYIYGQLGIDAALKYKRSSYRVCETTSELFDVDKSSENIQSLRDYETNTYLRDTILFDSDQAGLSNGKEIRPVFLSQHVYSFAESLDSNEMISDKFTKLILKKMVSTLLPNVSFFTPKKKGFELPYANFLNKTLHNYVGNELDQFQHSKYKDIIDYDVLKRKWSIKKFSNGDWRSIILICWLNKQTNI
jgi:asparagine synthase (glutamine-hydrolysing)